MADMDIRPPAGSRKSKRIAGRGPGGRRGATAGKGDKGQNSRSGGGVRPGFEGGQMPLYRRIPRKGFSNFRFKKNYDVVNVAVLENRYVDGEVVDLQTLQGKGIVKGRYSGVKILGTGELSKKLTVSVDAVSASAKAKIESAGGKVAGSETPVAEAIEKEAAVEDAEVEETKGEEAEADESSETEESNEEKGSVDGE